MIRFLKNKKILITGGHGFLGTHLVTELLNEGFKTGNLFTPRSNELDLRIADNCRKAVKDMDVVIHLATNVGGIGYNQKNPATLFYDNLSMGLNLIEEARLAKVKKFVAIGTVCAYPKYTKVPFKEKDLWEGFPEETNAPYGLSKKILLTQLQAYRAQYNFNSIYLLLVNLYGPGDNFDNNSSHVIPALIKKFSEAKKHNDEAVTVWGSGKATREFLYVTDCARAIIKATELYNNSEPVNIGSSSEISISDLATVIAKLVNYRGKIIFDKTKPDGQPRRKLNVDKAKREFGFKSTTSFIQGLRKTIDWYNDSKI